MIPENYEKNVWQKVKLKKIFLWIDKAKQAWIKVNINLTALDNLSVDEIFEVIYFANENDFVIRICEPTHMAWVDETKSKDIFKKVEARLKKEAISIIESYCDSVVYLTMKNWSKVTIMSNLCDNRFCDSCSKYLYLRLTSDKKFKPCLSRTDTEVEIWDDLSDENLNKAFCIAINNMWKWPEKADWMLLEKKIKRQ